MAVLAFAFVAVTLVGVFKLLLTNFWGAALLLVCSALGFVAGSGTRGAFYLGQRRSGLIVGAVLLIASLAIGFYSDLDVTIFGLSIAADTWAGIGAAIGFFAAKPKDVLPHKT